MTCYTLGGIVKACRAGRIVKVTLLTCYCFRQIFHGVDLTADWAIRRDDELALMTANRGAGRAADSGALVFWSPCY